MPPKAPCNSSFLEFYISILFLVFHRTMLNTPSQLPFSPKTPDHGLPMQNPDHPSFQLSDYLIFDDSQEEELPSPEMGFSQNLVFPIENFHQSKHSAMNNPGSSTKNTEYGGKKIKVDTGLKIAFRTKSELEILDDGFKWRKYGKKTVKNSPNPRNYYRCSNGGCPVKKRVERDGEDRNYVITTYEGVHNHESPSVIYRTPHQTLTLAPPNPLPLPVPPHAWT